MRRKLVIRSISVWGHPNLRTWTPDDPSSIAEVVWLDVGERSTESADTFRLRVATPAGLSLLPSREGIVAKRPLLVMERYDFDDLFRWLERVVAECERESWPHSVEALRRFFDWEYDAYQQK